MQECSFLSLFLTGSRLQSVHFQGLTETIRTSVTYTRKSKYRSVLLGSLDFGRYRGKEMWRSYLCYLDILIFRQHFICICLIVRSHSWYGGTKPGFSNLPSVFMHWNGSFCLIQPSCLNSGWPGIELRLDWRNDKTLRCYTLTAFSYLRKVVLQKVLGNVKWVRPGL